MTLREVQPYEILKTALDQAHKDFDEALSNLTRHVNHKDGPMLLLIDIEAVFKAHAVVKACEDAFTREYAHMVEVNTEIRAQRDEINRKFEAFKRTLNQLNLEQDTTAKTNANTSTSASSKSRTRRK